MLARPGSFRTEDVVSAGRAARKRCSGLVCARSSARREAWWAWVVAVGAAPELVEAVQDGQAGFGSVDLGHGDGPVHLEDRGAGLLGERLVQRGDRPPVAGLMQVPVGDGRLEQVGTEGTVLAVFEMGGATCLWRLTRSCGGY